MRSVCRSATVLSPAKTAEPIEMPFGLRTRVGPGNHDCIRWGSRSPWQGAILGREESTVSTGTFCCELCKAAERVDLPFGLWTRAGRRKHRFNRIRQVAPTCPHRKHSGATWRIRLSRPSAAAMRSYVKNYFDHLLLLLDIVCYRYGAMSNVV